MPVHKPKGSPYWHYDFTLDGVRFRGSTKAKNRRTAEQIEARERDAILLGRAKARTILLGEAFERYYQEVAQYTATADDVDAQLDRMLKALGNRPLNQITDSDIAEMVARRRGETARHGRKLVSNATVNRETQLLRRVFRRARDAWGITLTMPRWSEHLLPEAQERVRELSADEERRFLAALRPDYRPLVEFCLMTGARLTSAIRLTWKDVDYEAGFLAFRVKSRNPGGAVHRVPLTQALLVLLAQQRGRHPIYVFTYECARSRGKRRAGERYPFSQNGWRRHFQHALSAAGIEDFRFHDLRHTAGSRITRARGIHVAQKLLGHADITTTKRYAHVQMDDLRAAMEEAEKQRPDAKLSLDPAKVDAGGQNGGSE